MEYFGASIVLLLHPSHLLPLENDSRTRIWGLIFTPMYITHLIKLNSLFWIPVLLLYKSKAHLWLFLIWISDKHFKTPIKSLLIKFLVGQPGLREAISMSCITNGSTGSRKTSHSSSVSVARKETFSSAAKRYLLLINVKL